MILTSLSKKIFTTEIAKSTKFGVKLLIPKSFVPPPLKKRCVDDLSMKNRNRLSDPFRHTRESGYPG
jgi:hypothetical protein